MSCACGNSVTLNALFCTRCGSRAGGYVELENQIRALIADRWRIQACDQIYVKIGPLNPGENPPTIAAFYGIGPSKAEFDMEVGAFRAELVAGLYDSHFWKGEKCVVEMAKSHLPSPSPDDIFSEVQKLNPTLEGRRWKWKIKGYNLLLPYLVVGYWMLTCFLGSLVAICAAGVSSGESISFTLPFVGWVVIGIYFFSGLLLMMVFLKKIDAYIQK